MVWRLVSATGYNFLKSNFSSHNSAFFLAIVSLSQNYVFCFCPNVKNGNCNILSNNSDFFFFLKFPSYKHVNSEFALILTFSLNYKSTPHNCFFPLPLNTNGNCDLYIKFLQRTARKKSELWDFKSVLYRKKNLNLWVKKLQWPFFIPLLKQTFILNGCLSQ